MRSWVDTLNWKRCILCGKLAVMDETRPTARTRVLEVKTDKVMETMLRLCEERQEEYPSNSSLRDTELAKQWVSSSCIFADARFR